MALSVHKPVHVKTQQENEIFLQLKFISLFSLMNKLILSMIIMK